MSMLNYLTTVKRRKTSSSVHDEDTPSESSKRSKNGANSSEGSRENVAVINTENTCESHVVASTEVAVDGLQSRNPSGKVTQSKSFKQSWKVGRNWLFYIQGEGMYYKICQKHDKIPFERLTWNREPCVRFRLESVKEHEKSTAHKDAVLKEAESASTPNIGVILQPEVSLSDMTQVFAALYFLCKQRIAHTTNFEPLLDLIGLLGNSLKSKIRCGKNATYCSDKSIQGMLHCLSATLENDILSALQSSDHFSLMFDETTDCTVVEQMVIRSRYIDTDGKLCVRYIKILDALQPLDNEESNGDHAIALNAKNISDRVKEFMKANNLEYRHLRGIGTDGAAVMVGKHGGAVKRLKDAQAEAQQDLPNTAMAIGSHCAAHKLNLAVKQAGDHIPYVKKFNAILRQLYDFFASSAVRSAGLKAVQTLLEEPTAKVLQPSSTRWLSIGTAAVRLHSVLPTVIISLGRESEERGDATAAGLQKLLQSYSFIATLMLFCDILPTVNRLSKTFQLKELDFSLVESTLQATVSILKSRMSSDGEYLGNLQSYIENLTSLGCLVQYNAVSHRSTATLDGNQDSTSATALEHNAKEQFSQNIKEPLIAKLIENIENRFQECNVMSAFSIFNPQKLPENFNEFGNDQLEVLAKQFGKSMSSELLSEYGDFKHYMDKNMRDQSMHATISILSDRKTLQPLFPSIAFFADAFRVLPPHTADCERDFSQLKLVKTAQRNRMKESTLDAILRIAIEGPELEEYPFRKAVQLWASTKCRRLKIDC